MYVCRWVRVPVARVGEDALAAPLRALAGRLQHRRRPRVGPVTAGGTGAFPFAREKEDAGEGAGRGEDPEDVGGAARGVVRRGQPARQAVAHPRSAAVHLDAQAAQTRLLHACPGRA